MDELTQLIKRNIKLKYSSTRKFSEELGIPQTTIVSSIKNGVSGTAFTTVTKMCKALDIKLINGVYPVIVSDATRQIVEKLSSLDEKGIHTVTTVLEMEYLRCKAESENIAHAEQLAKQENNMSYQQINQTELPTKDAVDDLLKALNDDEDALNH